MLLYAGCHQADGWGPSNVNAVLAGRGPSSLLHQVLSLPRLLDSAYKAIIKPRMAKLAASVTALGTSSTAFSVAVFASRIACLQTSSSGFTSLIVRWTGRHQSGRLHRLGVVGLGRFVRA